jgi:hypothetical protein
MPETTATATNDPLDAELRRIATALVAEAPEAPDVGDDRSGAPVLELVLTRDRPGRPPARRRVPRLAAVAAAAIVALIAGAVIAVTGGDDEPTEPDYGFLAQAGLEPAPQRLLYDDDTNRELTADDRVVDLELAGLGVNTPVQPLPDGGHVVVGYDPVDYPPPEDFNEFTDLVFGLAVVGPDGQVQVERDLVDESDLVGVTSTDALLYRQPEDDRGRATGPASLVAHNLATGEERVLHEAASFDPNSNEWARWAVVGSHLVTVAAVEHLNPDGPTRVTPETVECVLRMTDLTNGEEEQRPLDLPCSLVMGLQASPDGSRAAVVYENDEPDELTGATYLAVVDLPSGEVVHDELIGLRTECTAASPCPPNTIPIEYHGMAWDDAATVRVALTDMTSPPGELVVKRIAIG